MADESTGNVRNLPVESHLQVSGLIESLLAKFQIVTVADLTAMDLRAVAREKGVGKKKIEVLETLIEDAKKLTEETDNQRPVPSVAQQCSLLDNQARLPFIPSLLRVGFDSGKIETIGDLLSLETRRLQDLPWWGGIKIASTEALQRFYWRLSSDETLTAESPLASFVEPCILPSPSLGPMPVREFVDASDSLRLKGKAMQESLDLKSAFVSRFDEVRVEDGISDMDWRAIPLRIKKRTRSFLVDQKLFLIKDVRRLALRPEVFCETTQSWVSATDKKGFSDGSLRDLRRQLRALEKNGFERYRYGESGKPADGAALVRMALAALKDRESEILSLRSMGMTLDQASSRFGLTRERTRQIEKRALEKLCTFCDVANEMLEPARKRFENALFMDIAELQATLSLDHAWHVILLVAIARKDWEKVDNDRVAKFPSPVVQALAKGIRKVFRTGGIEGLLCLRTIQDLVDYLLLHDEKPTKISAALVNYQSEHIPTDAVRELLGQDQMKNEVRSQLVKAGFNGMTFEEVDTGGIIETPEALLSFLGNSAQMMSDGRFRRSGKTYSRADEIVQIVREAEQPVDSTYIMSKSRHQWHQSVLVGRYLGHLNEIVTTGRGRYIHIEKLGLSVQDVVTISQWGAALLAGERKQIDGEELFDLFSSSGLEQRLANPHQLVSIIAKHQDVRRLSNNLQLAHRDSFDESELSLEKADPEIASQWHPAKNGELTPAAVRPNSFKVYWWKCDVGHEFQAMPVYRTRMVRTCPGCQERWNLEKIRHFVGSLQQHLDSFSPAELYVIFQQSGLLNRGGQAKGFVKSLATGRFPREELKKFVAGEESLVDDFLGDDEFSLESLEEITDGADPEAVSDVEPATDQGEGEMELPRVRAKAVLESLDCPLVASTDAEAAEFLVASAKAKIWSHVYRDERAALDEVNRFGESQYANRVRDRFLNEYEHARSLKIPAGYSFAVEGELRDPNLMQRHVAVQIRDRKRFGNWSGTGAGKTLSAILGTRVCEASLTLVCCPNAVVGDANSGWVGEIRRVFPDSDVQHKTWEPDWKPESRHRYLVQNYEQFQQSRSEGQLKRFLSSHSVDFIVIDEVHFAKQRFANQMSERKRLVQALVAEAGRVNADLRVLGLSATPVINNLQEGRSLIEMITGTEHEDLATEPSVANCIQLHQQLAMLGTRWRPEYEASLSLTTPEVDCSDVIDEIKSLGKRPSPLEVEQILTHVRLPKILERLSSERRTLIYTHYVQGIDRTLYDAIRKAGYRVGFYTGEFKEGLQAFKDGRLDVLIGSSAVSTGVDGLQHVCDQLIINVLPWTNAEYEQLIGRVWRQGQRSSKVDVIVPITFAEISGERWSYCESKLSRIRYKKSIADAAVDGVVPEGHLRSPAQAQRDLLAWLERLEGGQEHTVSRRPIIVPLSDCGDRPERRLAKYGDFSQMNNRWNGTRSTTLNQRLAENPEEWEQYHTLYRKARENWAVVPFEEFIRWCVDREGYVIVDFGCGEARVAEAISDRHTVHSFDHIAISDMVIEGDMASTPLDDESVDVALFSLSLMGSNFTDYLREAHRVLRLDGHLHIWEATSRFTDITRFGSGLERLGFRIFPPQQEGQFTHVQGQKSDAACNQSVTLTF